MRGKKKSFQENRGNAVENGEGCSPSLSHFKLKGLQEDHLSDLTYAPWSSESIGLIRKAVNQNRQRGRAKGPKQECSHMSCGPINQKEGELWNQLEWNSKDKNSLAS